jgi:hypothetical protein
MCLIDLGIVLDSSCSIEAGTPAHNKKCDGSITCPNWDRSVQFVTNIANNVNIDPNGAWLSLVEFAHQVSDNLLPSGSVNKVNAMISELPKHGPHTMGCDTYTKKGLMHMENMLLGEGRPRAPKVALVITDGKPTGKGSVQRAIHQAKDMKAHGIRIIGVGVGSAINRDFMLNIVSNPSDYHPVADWTSISMLLHNITDAACGTKYECVDEAMCMPSTSPSAVHKDDCESTCGAKYECTSNACVISTSPQAVSKYTCEYTCGKTFEFFPPPGVDEGDEGEPHEEGFEEEDGSLGAIAAADVGAP